MEFELYKGVDNYVLYKIIEHDKSIGLYNVISGSRKDVLKYISDNKIVIGRCKDGKKKRDYKRIKDKGRV